jgi:hypothetical protein
VARPQFTEAGIGNFFLIKNRQNYNSFNKLFRFDGLRMCVWPILFALVEKFGKNIIE